MPTREDRGIAFARAMIATEIHCEAWVMALERAAGAARNLAGTERSRKREWLATHDTLVSAWKNAETLLATFRKMNGDAD